MRAHTKKAEDRPAETGTGEDSLSLQPPAWGSVVVAPADSRPRVGRTLRGGASSGRPCPSLHLGLTTAQEATACLALP